MQLHPASPATPRPMRPTERALVADLGAELFARYGDYRKAIQAWLRQHRLSCQVLRENGGPLQAFCLIGLIPSPDGRLLGYVYGVGVRAEFRGSGLGRKVLEAALAEVTARAARWGISEVVLEVAEHNHGARCLFRSAGFSEDSNAPVAGERRYPSGARSITMSRPLEHAQTDPAARERAS